MTTGVETMQKDIGQYGAGISRNLFGKLGGTIRAFLLCLILAVAVTAVDTVVDPGMAEAAISKNECSAEGQPPCPIRYKGTVCDSGLGNIDGLCRKCGREGQHACPKSVKGKPCLGGRMKIDGRCYAKCGGADQKACNKAKKGYPCRGKYEPDSKGFCKPCGGANQNACRALKAGEQCNPGTTKHKGICKPCGNRGQQACPALAKGYPCKGRNEPDSRGICAPCGGNGQKACRALKAGKQCDAGTRKLGGECFSCGAHGQVPCPGLAAGKRCEAGTKKIGSTCQRCGGANERACPKLATGYPCRGKYRPDSSNICKPCGGVGEPSCRVFKAGRQCAEWSTSRKGQCVPCGDRNQDACRITDKGKPCKPGLKRELGGTCVLTPAGMVRQAALVQLSKDSKSLTAMLRKGSELNSDEDLKNGIRKGAETASDNEDAGRSTRSARSSNAGGGSAAIRTLDPRNDRFSGDRPKPICPAGTNTWSIGVGVEAGLIVNFEGEAGMAFNCGGNRADTKDAKWYFSKSLNFRLGGGASGGFTLSFWTVDVSQLRGKSHGYVLDVIEAVENMTGMSKEVKALMTGDIKKIKKALGAVSPELTIGVWFERRNEDGEGVGWIKENDVGRFLGYTITFTKGVGWDAGGAHILATTEQICTVDMKCAEGTWAGKIDRRNGTIYVDRQTKDHVYASINGGAPMKLDRVTEAGRKYRVGDSGHQIRYRHNFTELQYRSGNSGSWSKNFSLAKDPTLAGVYSLNRGSQNMVSLVVDNVQNKGFHAQLNHGQRQRFTRKRGKNLVYTGGGATITFRNEFRKVNYRGQDGIGYELTRGSADDIVGGGTFSHSALRGEWNMRVPGGRTVVEDVTDSNAEKIEVKRAGTEFVRTYNLTGDRNDGTYEYTSDAGGRFRFISPTRGIWISGDGQTVFQMQKK
ncbi:MAG: hypothetical protein O3B08_08785 [Proteobacteria bacterium]|nr:hypothetical protein [Pseudomonadota bacterium]